MLSLTLRRGDPPATGVCCRVFGWSRQHNAPGASGQPRLRALTQIADSTVRKSAGGVASWPAIRGSVCAAVPECSRTAASTSRRRRPYTKWHLATSAPLTAAFTVAGRTDFRGTSCSPGSTEVPTDGRPARPGRLLGLGRSCCRLSRCCRWGVAERRRRRCCRIPKCRTTPLAQ